MNTSITPGRHGFVFKLMEHLNANIVRCSLGQELHGALLELTVRQMETTDCFYAVGWKDGVGVLERQAGGAHLATPPPEVSASRFACLPFS